ncbi:MAG: hypothetical protein Q9218_004346 [Villophora microphyllina]
MKDDEGDDGHLELVFGIADEDEVEGKELKGQGRLRIPGRVSFVAADNTFETL